MTSTSRQRVPGTSTSTPSIPSGAVASTTSTDTTDCGSAVPNLYSSSFLNRGGSANSSNLQSAIAKEGVSYVVRVSRQFRRLLKQERRTYLHVFGRTILHVISVMQTDVLKVTYTCMLSARKNY